MLGRIPRPVPGPDARDAVLDQLRRAEYHRGDRSYVEQARGWVSGHLERLFAGLRGPAWSPDAWGFWTAVAIGLAVVGYALWRAGWPARRARSARDGADLLAPEPATDHRRLAREHAAAGRRDEALREWLRAAVATIEDRGVLAPRPGRTGAATAREAGPRLPSAAGPLTDATRAFDEVFFGGRAATDADVAVARRAAELVESATVAAT